MRLPSSSAKVEEPKPSHSNCGDQLSVLVNPTSRYSNGSKKSKLTILMRILKPSSALAGM